MKVRIKLYDQLDYLVHTTEVEHPLKKFYIWGPNAFEKVGKQRYCETTFGVIHDTQRFGFKTSKDDDV